jgi:hypothetical protein
LPPTARRLPHPRLHPVRRRAGTRHRRSPPLRPSRAPPLRSRASPRHPMPTSPTTTATRRSSGLAPVRSTAKPQPPPRALSGVPLLPEIPQSSYPPHRVALATIPDPPRRWLTLKSGRPPPLYSGHRSLPYLCVGHANAGTGPCPVLCQWATSLAHARASPASRGPRALCKQAELKLWTWATRYCTTGLSADSAQWQSN